MRHPFDGIICPEQGSGSSLSEPETKNRRSFLRFLAGTTTALVGLGATAGAHALQPDDQGRMTTQAIGEEGGGGGSGGGNATTLATGEEGGGRYTTQAIGEEGGSGPRPPRQRYTTYAWGEEGGRGRPTWGRRRPRR